MTSSPLLYIYTYHATPHHSSIHRSIDSLLNHSSSPHSDLHQATRRHHEFLLFAEQGRSIRATTRFTPITPRGSTQLGGQYSQHGFAAVAPVPLVTFAVFRRQLVWFLRRRPGRPRSLSVDPRPLYGQGCLSDHQGRERCLWRRRKGQWNDRSGQRCRILPGPYRL